MGEGDAARRVDLVDAVVAHLADAPAFVMTHVERDARACNGGALLAEADLASRILEFVRPYQSVSDSDALARGALPEGYVMAPVRAFGAVLWLPVRSGSSLDLFFSEPMFDRYEVYTDQMVQNNWDVLPVPLMNQIMEGGSCSCSRGGGSCTYVRRGVRGMWAEWCATSDCEACTLS